MTLHHLFFRGASHHRAVIKGIITAIILFIFYAAAITDSPVNSQTVPPTVCSDVRYMMAEDITPYDRGIDGGVLSPNQPQNQTIANTDYAAIWSFNVVLERNAGNIPVNDILTIRFDTVSDHLGLEVGVFSAMTTLPTTENITGYRPVLAGQTMTYPLTEDGIYTIVLRRVDLTSMTTGDYTFTASFPGNDVIEVGTLRDNSTGQASAIQPEMVGGYESFFINTTHVRAHAASINSVGSHFGERAQVIFEPLSRNAGFLANGWADQMTFLGGDLVISGIDNGRPRRFFLQDFGWAINYTDGSLVNVTDSNGLWWRLSWDNIRDVWITKDCAGFRLDDGRTFTGTLDPNDRQVVFQGDLTDFAVRLASPLPDNTIAKHELTLNWQFIAAGSELYLHNGVLYADIVNGRRLELESTQIDLHQASDDATLPEDTPLNITLADRDATITLDWQNMQRFALLGNLITLDFMDSPRSTTTRSGANLHSFEAIDDIIHIVYHDDEDGTLGEQRLLLPAENSYIEIVTSAGMPPFDGTKLPGETGYMPRALNNLGGECYPINTFQPQANCPPNGHPNPANNNIWVAITDLLAEGRPLDLALTRSYNSLAARINGPFGYGWSTLFALDYQTAFDPVANARVITQEGVAAAPVGLDLTWAPRGMVTFMTESGSRHVFIAQANHYTAGEMTALTMPGWTLSRDAIRDAVWTLKQDNGNIYLFDRAGRLLQFGTQYGESTLTIDYAGNYLNGLADLKTTPVIITDVPSMRRLELYFDDAHHITRSVLRDMTKVADTATLDTAICHQSANCWETRYQYDAAGWLQTVNYADGNQATYHYEVDDGAIRGMEMADPRAPIAPHMTTVYAEDGRMVMTIVPENGERLPWRQLNPPTIDDTTRTVTVTDEYGNTRDYTYNQAVGEIKVVGNEFTLLSETSPLAEAGEFEALPIIYQWQNGLLTGSAPRRLNNGEGRKGIDFNYSDEGRLTSISGGFPRFGITYGNCAPRPCSLTFADGTVQTFTYDEHGWIETSTDQNGAIQQYFWDDSHHLVSTTTANDSTAVDYAYNAAGLVIGVTQRHLVEAPSAWRIVRYYYDGLGRLIAVDDPTTGDYTLNYAIVLGEDGTNLAQINVTDATGTTTRTTLGYGNRIIEQTIRNHKDEILRKTTYTYDALGRMTSQQRWVSTETEAENQQQYTTQYIYEQVKSLPALPGDKEPTETIINGLAVHTIDAYGRTETTIHDALGRLRQIEDIEGHLTRYDYDVNANYADSAGEKQVFPGGLRIIQREVQNNQLVSTRDYLFDGQWQFRQIIDDVPFWEFYYSASTNPEDLLRIRALQGSRTGFASIVWAEADYQNGRPTTLAINPTDVDLVGDTNNPSINRDAAYDFRARPLNITGDDGQSYAIRYCPVAYGGEIILYFEPDAENPTCDNPAETEGTASTAARAVYLDAQGRLRRVEEAHRVRTYDYVPQIGEWLVTVTFTDLPTTTAYSWELRYNGVGDLLQWTNESNQVRHYQYDRLGRLVRVEVPDQPEASMSYTYNALDLVTTALDDAGRGTLYAYDHLGRLTSQQDALTANATTYGYNGDGELSTIISPLGSTTTFLYDDPYDPTRLTGIIEPTGSTVQFDWLEQENKLVYTDQRSNQTIYHFDGFGALWRIDDALEQTHELHYDAGGNLIAWKQSLENQQRAAQYWALQWDTPNTLIVTDGTEQLEWSRTFTLNPNGQLTQVLGQSGHALDFDYDALGRLTDARSSRERWSLRYLVDQPALIFTDESGIPHTLYFDALNRLVVDEYQGKMTTYDYEAAGQGNINLTITNSAPQIYTFAAGDDTLQSSGIERHLPGRRESYIENEEGLLIEILSETCAAPDALAEGFDPTRPDACLRSTDVIWRVSERFVYDTLGRPVRHIDPEQNIATYAYDEAGNLSAYQDFDGKTFAYTYDALHRLASITGPTGTRLLMNYDAQSNVTGICRTRTEQLSNYHQCASDGGVLEEYTYDSLGRLTTQTFPNGKQDTATVNYTYSASNDGTLSGWRAGDRLGGSLMRTNDGVGMPQLFSTSGENYGINASIGGQLDRAGDLVYTYDEYGRLKTVNIHDHTLSYAYLTDNGGLTITDEVSGATIQFLLDERGFLTEITSIGQIDHFISPDGRTLIVDIQLNNDDGELIELQINRRGETKNITYLVGNFFADNTLDADGQLQRQSIIGGTEYFEMNARGYISVIGYDNDKRPVTMRVTDRETGQLLYLLTFTYSAMGQRESETRLYEDGSQMTIAYTYNDGNQPATRTILLKSSANETAELNGTPFLFLAGILTWLLHSQSRRRLLLLAFAVGVAIPTGLLLITAQQPKIAGETQVYHYDAAGNLNRITIAGQDRTCATFGYDSANHLTQVTQGDRLQTYTYDAFNRVSTVGNQRLIYHGDTHTLLATILDDGTLRFHGTLGDLPEFFQTDGTNTIWLTNDGRRSILATTESIANEETIRLLDPLGRFLSFHPPENETINPCQSTHLDGQPLQAISPVQAGKGVVWDASTNLYFINGRVYIPELGRFLQRNPLGPDAFGNLYDYPAEQSRPPVRERPPAYTDGLLRLREALTVINTLDTMAAERVLAAALPKPSNQGAHSLPGALWQTRAQYDRMLVQQFDLPLWVMTQYSLPAPYLDVNNALRLSQDNTPGNGGLSGDIIASNVRFDPSTHWRPEIMMTFDQLESLAQLSMPPDRGIVLYDPAGWQPTLAALTQVWTVDVPVVLAENMPNAVQKQLPQNLKNPAATAKTLDTILALMELPHRTGESWLQAALDEALPTQPDLPVADDGQWLQNWFTSDLFGVAEILAARQLDLPDINTPIYGLEVNTP